jgi:V/A-type H+-transporting ATPase subunit E
MPQQVQELIEKIKTEGVRAADEKAKEIEAKAQTDAQKVITDANGRAKQIIADANTQAKRLQESAQIALKQAARDTLLALRREIEGVLKKVISAQVSDALSPDHLADILGEVIQRSVDAKLADGDIFISLNPKDLKKFNEGFMAKLQKQMKNSIKLQPKDDLAKGFTISFDEGRSFFDFSDASLAEYLSTYLNAQVAALIQDAE